jgi:sulfite reductase (NADPH) flavoprotein alpha-component
MKETNLIPCLPETAPFTPEQRAYLNGFLAGLFSRTGTGAVAKDTKPELAQPPLTVLFGSQTGNAETLAKRAAKEAAKRGFAATVFDMAEYPTANLPAEKNLLIITSTYGDGDPPDNAKAFWQFLSETQPALGGVKFSVLALGDSNYPKFCECGKYFDRRLEECGARRIQPRVDCDVDFEEQFSQWLDCVLEALALPASSPSSTGVVPGQHLAPSLSVSSNGAGSKEESMGRSAASHSPAYSRKNPFPAPLLANRNLNGATSAKETRHVELSLDGSGLNYQAGDALGVVPANCPALVQEILAVLGSLGDETVPHSTLGELSFRDALRRGYEITRIPQPLLHAFAERTGDEALKKVTAPDANGVLTQFLWGREIIDLLLAFPQVKFSPAEFVALLKKLPPRLYSISSCPKVHLGQVHLTVGVVRYESLGRTRKGVCSCFLAERAEAAAGVPVFVHQNKNFRPPADGDRPMIMVGPGTGIAPFRAFLYERKATGASGRNWLLFGDQHSASDFLYREETETLARQGALARLDTAFSRDQPEKIYVQHRMLENARELFDWLEQGAHFYVCGDAKRMAKDVEEALHRVVETGGGRNREQAAEYVSQLKAEKRYQRDIY